jgi:hypothetical protein
MRRHASSARTPEGDLIMRLRTLSLVVLAIAVAAPAAVAQPVDGPFADEAFDAVVRFLELDDAQTGTFVTLLEDRDLAATPLRDDLAEVEEAIRDEIESETPDVTVVGELVLERHALRESLREVQLIFVDGFTAMLDEDQAQRLGLVRAAKRVRPVIPAFERFGLLLPPAAAEEGPIF